VPVELVVTSPLVRAYETAAAISRLTAAPLETSPDLADRDDGPWAGRPREDLEAAPGGPDGAPGIGGADVFAARVMTAWTEIERRVGSSAAVVVAHDAVNRCMLHLLIPGLADPDQIEQRTGCWNRLELRPAGWRAPVIDAIPGDEQRP